MKSIPKEDRKCTNCGAVESPLWRRLGPEGKVVCNACGLYFRNHGTMRDVNTLFSSSAAHSASKSHSHLKEKSKTMFSTAAGSSASSVRFESGSRRKQSSGQRSDLNRAASSQARFSSKVAEASAKRGSAANYPPEYQRLLEVADLAALYAGQRQPSASAPALYRSASVFAKGTEVRSGSVVEYFSEGSRYAIIERIFRDASGTAYFLPINIVRKSSPTPAQASASQQTADADETDTETLNISNFVLSAHMQQIAGEGSDGCFAGKPHTVPLQPVAKIAKVFRLSSAPPSPPLPEDSQKLLGAATFSVTPT